MKDTDNLSPNSEESALSTETGQPPNPSILQLPLDDNKVAGLRAGQWVHASGACYVIGYQASQHLLQDSAEGQSLPLDLDLRHATVYFSTPGYTPMGAVIGSLAPHYTGDFEPLMHLLLEQGVQGFIGRGPLSDDLVSRLKRKRGVYFVSVGGAGALLADTVYQAQVVALEALGREAIRQIKVENFPCVVAIDGFGRNQLHPPSETDPTKESE